MFPTIISVVVSIQITVKDSIETKYFLKQHKVKTDKGYRARAPAAALSPLITR